MGKSVYETGRTNKYYHLYDGSVPREAIIHDENQTELASSAVR